MSIPLVFISGKAFTSSQRQRPTSPFSTDSNTSAAQNQSQRPRPTKKHKGGRMDPQPVLPHRREGMPDGRLLILTTLPHEMFSVFSLTFSKGGVVD